MFFNIVFNFVGTILWLYTYAVINKVLKEYVICYEETSESFIINTFSKLLDLTPKWFKEIFLNKFCVLENKIIITYTSIVYDIIVSFSGIWCLINDMCDTTYSIVYNIALCYHIFNILISFESIIENVYGNIKEIINSISFTFLLTLSYYEPSFIITLYALEITSLLKHLIYVMMFNSKELKYRETFRLIETFYTVFYGLKVIYIFYNMFYFTSIICDILPLIFMSGISITNILEIHY